MDIEKMYELENEGKTKRCCRCLKVKPLDEFSKDKRSKDGIRSHCKNCAKKEYKKKAEYFKEYHKEYYKKHKEEINPKNREHYNSIKEEQKERFLEYAKKYRE